MGDGRSASNRVHQYYISMSVQRAFHWTVLLFLTSYVRFQFIFLQNWTPPSHFPSLVECFSTGEEQQSSPTKDSSEPWEYIYLDQLPHPEQRFPVQAIDLLPAALSAYNNTLSTCVPALFKDAKHNLPNALRSFAAQTVLTDEVVIVMSNVVGDNADDDDNFNNTKLIAVNSTNNTSSTNFDGTAACRDSLIRLQSELSNYTNSSSSIPLRLVCVGERMTAGRARNLAAKLAGGSLISFIDADDAELEDRNQVIHDTFACYPELRLLLHGFKQLKLPHRYYKLTSNATQICPDQQEGLEMMRGTQLYNRLEESHQRWWIDKAVAHGHPVLDRRVIDFVQYTSLYRGEDSAFVRDVIYKYGRNNDNSTIFFNRPLTTYFQRSRSNTDLIHKK